MIVSALFVGTLKALAACMVLGFAWRASKILWAHAVKGKLDSLEELLAVVFGGVLLAIGTVLAVAMLLINA